MNKEQNLNKSQNSLNLIGTNLETSIEMLIQSNQIDNKSDLDNILSKIK